MDIVVCVGPILQQQLQHEFNHKEREREKKKVIIYLLKYIKKYILIYMFQLKSHRQYLCSLDSTGVSALTAELIMSFKLPWQTLLMHARA